MKRKKPKPRFPYGRVTVSSLPFFFGLPMAHLNWRDLAWAVILVRRRNIGWFPWTKTELNDEIARRNPDGR